VGLNKEEQKELDELKEAINISVDKEMEKHWESFIYPPDWSSGDSLRGVYNIAEAYERPKRAPAQPTRYGYNHICTNCGSTSHKVGFLGLLGERVCDNNECINSKRKFK
jgi:hypothetical protein